MAVTAIEPKAARLEVDRLLERDVKCALRAAGVRPGLYPTFILWVQGIGRGVTLERDLNYLSARFALYRREKNLCR